MMNATVTQKKNREIISESLGKNLKPDAMGKSSQNAMMLWMASNPEELQLGVGGARWFIGKIQGTDDWKRMDVVKFMKGGFMGRYMQICPNVCLPCDFATGTALILKLPDTSHWCFRNPLLDFHGMPSRIHFVLQKQYSRSSKVVGGGFNSF